MVDYNGQVNVCKGLPVTYVVSAEGFLFYKICKIIFTIYVKQNKNSQERERARLRGTHTLNHLCDFTSKI